MKKRIAVDMDGVMADITEHFFNYDEKDFGRKKTWEEIAGKPEREVFPNIRQYLFSNGFFRTAPVMKGSQEGLLTLTKHFDVFIVSAAMEFPQSLSEKKEWLQEHFPFIPWQQTVFCGVKTIIDADIMIDDHFKNLDPFRGTTLLYSQPHNEQKDEGRHHRVHSWTDILSFLLR